MKRIRIRCYEEIYKEGWAEVEDDFDMEEDSDELDSLAADMDDSKWSHYEVTERNVRVVETK